MLVLWPTMASINGRNNRQVIETIYSRLEENEGNSNTESKQIPSSWDLTEISLLKITMSREVLKMKDRGFCWSKTSILVTIIKFNSRNLNQILQPENVCQYLLPQCLQEVSDGLKLPSTCRLKISSNAQEVLMVL